jgi:predicted P-loop ATPase
MSPTFAALIADARKLIARVGDLPGDLNDWRPEHHDQWLELNRELDGLAHGAGAASVRGHDPDGEGEAAFIDVLAERLEREQIKEEIEKGKLKARREKLDDLSTRLAKAGAGITEGRRQKLDDLSKRLEAQKPDAFDKIKQRKEAESKELLKFEPGQILQFNGELETRKNPSGMATSLQNTLIALNKLKIDCRYDMFHNQILVEGRIENLEHICLLLRTTIFSKFRFDPGEHVRPAVVRMALEHQFNPVVDYLDGLKWDGAKRLHTWLNVYVGAEDGPLNGAIGRMFLVAAVRRARQPGYKFDHVVVFEGAQGKFKSTLVRELAGDGNFSDAEILGCDKKEQQELCQGVWFYELPELSGLHKSEVERVKAFISRQEDKARAAYARDVSIRPRTCVFVGTTNESHYLQDQTGNRRFLPVLIGEIDIEAIRRDRDQLFAEAAALEAAGEPIVLPKEVWEDARKLQDARLIADPWADKLWMFNDPTDVENFWTDNQGVDIAPNESGVNCWRVPSELILSTALGIRPEYQNNAQFKKIAVIMSRFGWKSRDVRFKSRVVKCWIREQ